MTVPTMYSALLNHPERERFDVVGIPHAELGEDVADAIVLNDGIETTPDDLRDFVKQQVAPYKYPRIVWFVDELPKTATGKILKRELIP